VDRLQKAHTWSQGHTVDTPLQAAKKNKDRTQSLEVAIGDTSGGFVTWGVVARPMNPTETVGDSRNRNALKSLIFT
jgi:hypothetical protein